jgi:ubiquinone/menaquinone biosynthesis C-methylase UbiE
MKNDIQQLIKLIKCPKCKSELRQVDDGSGLLCSVHGKFQIKKGIPSFTETTDFDSHWNLNYSQEIPVAKKKAACSFLEFGIKEISKRSKMSFLDVGCGDGIHAEVLSDCGIMENNIAMGVDMSLSAIEYASMRKTINWNFVHANALELPFANESFDLVYSFGVIAYTANPEACFNALCKVTKPDGLLGIWILPQGNRIIGIAFAFLRKMCRLLGPVGTRLIADIIVPFLWFVPTKTGINLANASWRQCREVVLVDIAPVNLVLPSSITVKKWFENNRISIVFEDQKSPLTLWGIKKKER